MQKDWATPTLLFGNMIMWKRKKQQINWMKNVRWYRGERIDKRSNILWGDNKSRDYLHAALSADSINLTIKMAVLLKTLFCLFFLTGIGLFNEIWEDSQHFQVVSMWSYNTLRQRSHGTGQIFDRWKIRAFGRFVHIEPRQTYENLDAQAFKTLNTKIEDELLAGAFNNLTATLWTP